MKLGFTIKPLQFLQSAKEIGGFTTTTTCMYVCSTSVEMCMKYLFYYFYTK